MKTKKLLAFLAIAVIIPGAILLSGFDSKKDVVRHIVVFKYKPSATEAQIKEVSEAFASLKDKIPGIISFEYGINNSSENKNNGFTHIYQLTFENIKARDEYLPHPEHEKFGELLGKSGILEDVFVVDYTPAK